MGLLISGRWKFARTYVGRGSIYRPSGHDRSSQFGIGRDDTDARAWLEASLSVFQIFERGLGDHAVAVAVIAAQS